TGKSSPMSVTSQLAIIKDLSKAEQGHKLTCMRDTAEQVESMSQKNMMTWPEFSLHLKPTQVLKEVSV
ncbi:hypothetical protein, partial [Campylobacter coli]|uniref:hypothetical protein n=1 Tax=Campylobacter coli TaxID=195 RepID=UPI001C8B7816